jgi:hypothetical protein
MALLAAHSDAARTYRRPSPKHTFAKGFLIGAPVSLGLWAAIIWGAATLIK